MTKSLRMRPVALLSFHVLVSVGLIVLLLSRVDVHAVLERFRAADFTLMSVVFAIFLVQIMLSVYRWGELLKLLALPFSFRRVLLIWMEGALFNQALPSVVGGDAVRAWRVWQTKSRLRQAATSVVLDRLFALNALLLMALVTAPVLLILANGSATAWALVGVVSTGCLGVVLFLSLSKLSPLGKGRFRVVQKLVWLAADTRRTLTDWKLMPKFVGLSVTIHVLSVLEIYVIGLALNTHVNLAYCLVLVPPVLLMQMLPVSLAGWGVRDGVLVTAFKWVSIPASQAIAISLTYGLFVLVTSLPGGAVWLYPKYQRALAGPRGREQPN